MLHFVWLKQCFCCYQNIVCCRQVKMNARRATCRCFFFPSPNRSVAASLRAVTSCEAHEFRIVDASTTMSINFSDKTCSVVQANTIEQENRRKRAKVSASNIATCSFFFCLSTIEMFIIFSRRTQTSWAHEHTKTRIPRISVLLFVLFISAEMFSEYFPLFMDKKKLFRST